MRHGGFASVTLVISFAVVASACGSGDSGDDTLSTFRSRTYGYSIDHPAGWTVVAAERELDNGQPPLTGPPVTDVIAQHANRKVRDMELPALVVGAQAVPAGTSIDDWTARVIETVALQKHCVRPDTTERLRLGSESAVLLSYPDCPSGSGLYHLWIAVLHGDRGFHIVWFNHEGHLAQDRALLDRMLSSISFD